MMKFVAENLERIEGVANYPMFSLLLFFVFFVVLFLWVITASKQHIREMSELPLKEDQQPNPSEP
jgi:cbb3-type cytochrome oxidase subunit 3